MHAGAIDAGDGRQEGGGAGVDDDGLGTEREAIIAAGDFHLLRAGEAGLPSDDCDAGGFCHLEVRCVEFGDEGVACVFGGLQCVRVVALASGFDNEFMRVCLGEELLGGHATDVDAGAAVHVGVAFDECDAVAGLSALHGDGFAGFAETHDNDVVGLLSGVAWGAAHSCCCS